MEVQTIIPPAHQLKIRYHSLKNPSFQELLTPQALAFLEALHRKFESQRQLLLSKRIQIQQQLDNGELPTFLAATQHIRESDWQVAPLPPDLLDRRVEITGPVDRKMVINALNSGANVYMADFEDSNTPMWTNNMEGQINLHDAIRRNIQFTHPLTGKKYALKGQSATLMIRPRGWHLIDKYFEIDDQSMSASLVDFGLYFFHNAHILIHRGSGPYFYLPKLENHLEARLWNDVFVFAQDYLDIPTGTIKATVLIETILASFEMNEILYELRDHSAGLNCGRWDYIFSFIKKFRNHEDFVLPNRAQITMETHFMNAYSRLVIQTCHKRGVHAMGGMAAQIPIKNDPEANEKALDKVRIDKLNEVKNGHDGTWVAHPALVSVAKTIFDQFMPDKNQIFKKRLDLSITAKDLLHIPQGTITEEGLRKNINVGLLYIESWLRGKGAAAIYHLMEDAATAEISRSQIWQWIHHRAQLDDGRIVTRDLTRKLLREELYNIQSYVGNERYESGRFYDAVVLFEQLIASEQFEDFLTIPAYNLL